MMVLRVPEEAGRWALGSTQHAGKRRARTSPKEACSERGSGFHKGAGVDAQSDSLGGRAHDHTYEAARVKGGGLLLGRLLSRVDRHDFGGEKQRGTK